MQLGDLILKLFIAEDMDFRLSNVATKMKQHMISAPLAFFVLLMVLLGSHSLR